MTALSHLLPSQFLDLSHPVSRSALYLLLGASCIGAYGLLSCLNGAIHNHGPRTLPPPQEAVLRTLSEEEIKILPYPPDAMPGARDVDTPFGSIRVYEWGPEDGPRVLFIHGISTPSVALNGLARNLADRGCRVMLFDLFSRGYSSGPHPSTHKYDNGLYITQILLVLASSRLPWRPFTIIGYSLGGAIAADFASYFPHLIKALFLIAPGGLIRKEHITFKSKVQYSGFGGLLPEKLVQWLISRRLYTGPETARSMEPETSISPPPSTATSGNDKTPGDGNNEDEDPKGGLRSTAIYRSSAHTLLPSRPESTVSAIVDWQIVHHAGFVPAFISSIRYAPIHEQGGRWRKIGEYMRQPGAGFTQVHLILGEEDGIIVAGEVIEDARRYLGEENVKVKVFEGTGHEVAFERVVEIGEIVGEVLGV